MQGSFLFFLFSIRMHNTQKPFCHSSQRTRGVISSSAWEDGQGKLSATTSSVTTPASLLLSTDLSETLHIPKEFANANCYLNKPSLYDLRRKKWKSRLLCHGSRWMRTPGQAHCYRPSAFPGQLKPGICISILCQASTRYIIINTSLPGERYLLMLDWVNIRESHTCICYPKRPDDGSLKHAKTLLLSLSYKFHEWNPASFVLSVFCLIMWQEHAVLSTETSW